MSTESLVAAHARTGTSVARLRAALVAVAVAVGGVSETAFIAWHGSYDPMEFPIAYDTFVPIRDAWLNTHYYLGIGMAVFMVGLAVAACMLTPARGAVWTTVGAAMTVLAGIVHLAGTAGEGVAMAYAADPAALPPAQGDVLLRFIFENDGRFVYGILAGILLMTLGGVLIGVGLARAHTVPRWVPYTLITSTLLLPVLPIAYGWLPSGVTTVVSVVIAWFAWRRVIA